jgi:hypothetical protein
VLAQDVHVEQALVRVVVANTVQAGPTTGILFAVARRIDGEAKILVDWRGALAFGAGLGAFIAVIHLARRWAPPTATGRPRTARTTRQRAASSG